MRTGEWTDLSNSSFFSVALLALTRAHATTTKSDIISNAPAPKTQIGLIQLAGSFHNSTAKLADKSWAGMAGGFYGIGGSEPHVKYFRNRMRKIPRCCMGTSQ